MSIWLFRAGGAGQYEKKFLEDGKVYLTWYELGINLSKLRDQQDLYGRLLEIYSDETVGRVRNWSGQIWPIIGRMEKGDWIVTPSKHRQTIHFGEITGDYTFKESNDRGFQHYREVNWFAKDIPRKNFDQDLLYSFGAFMTVCQISRNNAEERIKAMSKNGWQTRTGDLISENTQDNGENTEVLTDLETISKDQISNFIERKFKGHKMAVLIEELLVAKGFNVHRSPEGPDKGVDLLAAPKPMGFGSPKICVQVKSTENQVDRATLQQLAGAKVEFKADFGLLVSWSGFKRSVEREVANQFFDVRLWSKEEMITELQENYERLSEDFKTELPLKRVWTLSLSDE